MKELAVLGLAALLAGCSGGISDEFTAAECDSFVRKFMEYGEVAKVFPAEELAGMRTGLVQECTAKKIGLSREELDCAVKAATADEFRACGIVIQG